MRKIFLVLCLLFSSTELFARDQFASAQLLGLEYREANGAQIIELQFDQTVGFSKSFTPQGARTKSNPRLILDFPQTKIKGKIVRKHRFQGQSLLSYALEKRFSHGGVELQLEFLPQAKWDIKESGKKVSVVISKAAVAQSKTKTSAVAEKKTAPVVTQNTKVSTKPMVVVIDPGHGGEDVGATGKRGHHEKDVALAIAQKLAQQLKQDKNFKVYLTRERDKTLTLEQRNRFAREHHADLFLSIHANASTSRKLSGIQTYYLNNASDQAATKLAARENKYAGTKLPTEAQILSTMQQNDSAEESRLLAHEIQRSTLAQVRAKYKNVNDLKVHSALFYVLVGAKCPGVLVETSFISNPTEESRLIDAAYQKQLANGIAAGVKSFLEKQSRSLPTL